MALMFAFLVLSNAMMPLKNLPAFVEKIKYFIPTNDIVQTLKVYWLTGSIQSYEYIFKYLVYTIVLLLILLLSFKFKLLTMSNLKIFKVV